MVSLEFNGPGAGEIKRRPEVEVLSGTRDNRPEVMKKVLNRLAEGVKPRPGDSTAERYVRLFNFYSYNMGACRKT